MVSIIVPVYNVEKYVDRCIKSIAEQSYKDIEIILINDGSKDSSGKICDEWARKDDRIIVIHQENKGLPNARNQGLKIKKGEYFAFVDSDDFICSDMVQTLLDTAKKTNVDVVIYGFCDVNVEGKRILKNSDFYHQDKERYYNNKEFLINSINNVISPMVWDKFYKSETFKDIRFIENAISEDFNFLMDAMQYMNTAIYIPSRHYMYTFRKDSIANTINMDLAVDVIKRCLKDEDELVKKYGDEVKFCINDMIFTKLAKIFTKMPYKEIKEKSDRFKLLHKKLRENKGYILKANVNLVNKICLVGYTIFPRITWIGINRLNDFLEHINR